MCLWDGIFLYGKTWRRVRPILLVLGMLFCSPLGATEIAVVGVHFNDLSVDETELLNRKLEKRIRGISDLDAVGPEILRERLIGRQELVLQDMALSIGLKKLEEGKLLYDRAQTTQALPALEEALMLLNQSVSVTGETRHLRDAYLYLGLSHTALGNNADAKRSFAQAVVLGPEMELDPLRYPPRVQEAFSAIRDRIRAAPPATLRIQVPDQMPVTIWVDGRKRGSAPLTISGLPPGRHFIRAVGPFALRGYKSVGLSPDQDLPVFLPMDQHGFGQVASSVDDRARQTAALYKALGQHVQTELILVVGQVQDGQISAQLFSSRNGRFSKPLTLAASNDWTNELVALLPAVLSDANAQGDILSDKISVRTPALQITSNDILASLLLENQKIVTGVPAPREEKERQNDSRFVQRYKWWLVGGGAVVVGGVGAAIVVGTAPSDDGTITVGPIP